MQIYDFIEECHLELQHLTEDIRIQIPSAYPTAEWVKTGKLFVSGLDRTHQVPGRVIYSILDICEGYRESGSMTMAEQAYLAHNLIDYWSALSAEIRARIYF
jgi:hypothetical protein